MQDARDERRRGVQQAQVRFEREPVRVRSWCRRPENRVVVGEEGEEDAEEEGRRCDVWGWLLVRVVWTAVREGGGAYGRR